MSEALEDPALLKSSSYVNGEWADGSASVDVEDPGKGEVFASVSGGPELASAAVDAAANAQPAWAARSAAERGSILRALADQMTRHEDDLARLLTREHGKPLEEAKGEIRYAKSFVSFYAEEATRLYGESIPSGDPDRRLLTFRQPIGVGAGITPWNFPSAMITRKLAPALAVGCAFVLKPSKSTPLSALALAELGERAGIPRGVFNVVVGPSSSEIAGPWLEDARVRKLSFTGSTSVGKSLYESCAATVKKLSLELGGNAPFLVFDDADLDAAIDGCMKAKFRNGGQSCVAANRILVQSKVHDAFVEKLRAAVSELRPGYGFDADSTLGPLIDSGARDDVAALVTSAKAQGAEVVSGGSAIDRPGHFYEPTLVTGVRAEMDIATQEIFGPVASVLRFDDDAEGVAMANDVPYGLASYLYTRDLGRAWRISEALEYGMVGVNTGMVSNAAAPFGGIKQSGLGREGSHHGLDDWTELKYVAMAGLS